MARKDKFQSREPASYERSTGGRELRTGPRQPFIVFSLMHLDRTQGQNYAEWEAVGLLSKALAKLQAINSLTYIEATKQKIIKPYPSMAFPPESAFTHPKHIPPDVVWCSLHVQGKECLIGYFEAHIFYVVFLDRNHEFYITQKKNT